MGHIRTIYIDTVCMVIKLCRCQVAVVTHLDIALYDAKASSKKGEIPES